MPLPLVVPSNPGSGCGTPSSAEEPEATGAAQTLEDAAGLIRAAMVRKLGKYLAYFCGFLLYDNILRTMFLIPTTQPGLGLVAHPGGVIRQQMSLFPEGCLCAGSQLART